MKVTPIDNPVTGEWLLDVKPVMAPNTDAGWHRRLHYFTGRTLSHTALIAEQEGRSGRQALMGQGLSKGIISGIEIKKSDDAKRILISPGHGIALTGEDVFVPRSLQIEVRDIRVYAPVDLLPEPSDTTLSGSDALLARALGPTLGELIDDGVALPRAGILILQAVAVDIKGSNDETDPCEEDADNDAFENWQVADGVRLIYYAWPSDYLTLPSPSVAETTISEKSWQNRIAYQIFEKEKTVSYHPWDEKGVAIAIVGFDEAWNIHFVDRHSVARNGGKPRYRKLLANSFGSPFLWQARVEQFNAQISELSYIHASAFNEALGFADEAARQAYFKETVQDISESFRYLPPVGILPKQALNFETWESYFFQTDYQVEVVAVPLEQLDVVLEANASLEPYHVNEIDRVRVVVPVPQIWYEPKLLETESENPVFQQAIDTFSMNRAKLLDRRQEVREKISALNKALSTEAVSYPSPDPDALEYNESDWRFIITNTPDENWDELDYDDSDWLLTPQKVTAADQTILCRKRIDIKDVHKFAADVGIKFGGNYDIHINGIRSIVFGGATADEEYLQSLVNPPFMLDNFHDGENIVAIRFYDISDFNNNLEIRLVWYYLEDAFGTTGSPPYRSKSLDDLASWLQTSQMAASLMDTKDKEWYEIVNEILAMINVNGFDQFITDLQAMVDSADDTINLKFLKIQTDIYRLRQLMLGNDDSSRLATSPILASIAQGETALGTKEDLQNFYSKLKIDAGIILGNTPTGTGGSASDLITVRSTDSDIKKRETLNISEGMIDISIGGIDISDKVTDKRLDVRASASQEYIMSQDILFQTEDTTPVYDWVFQQQEIIGWIPQIRTTTVAERLKLPASVEAKNAAVATKYAAIQEILALDMFTDNIAVPGFIDADGIEVFKTFKEIVDEGLAAEVLSGLHDKVNVDATKEDGEKTLTDADEAAYYSAGVRALENASSMLRLVEARVNSYRKIILKSLGFQTEINENIALAKKRLAAISVDVAEARYDVSVAKALLEEELARVAEINERRKKILARHVPYLAFFRPRVIDSLQDTPIHPLNPVFTATPVPTCLNANVEVPEELGSMMEVLKDAPLKWFANADAILDKLNKDKQQKDLLAHSKFYANQNQLSPTVNASIGLGGNNIANALYHSISGMYQLVATHMQATAMMDLSIVNQQSWKKNKETVKDTVSLRDIIDGKHGNSKVSKELSQLLDDIASIASCLYQNFSHTPAKVRLEWSEKLSQYDKPVNLRNLTSLPRWSEIDYLDRQEMQTYVDWLHNQIDTSQSKATAIINDVVRVCLLLSSHSPVNKIISGSIKNSKTVKVGDYFDVIIDPASVYIGMEVLVYNQNKPVLNAVVNDFMEGEVSAKVVSTTMQTISLQQGAKTHFSHPGMYKDNPTTGKKSYFV